jgi:tetratricopeptide (TPR) repeat protein
MLDLLPGEWEVLAAVDGEQSLRAIAASLGRSEFEVAKIVFGLTAAGIVTLAERRPRAARNTASEGVAELVRQAEHALGAGDLGAAREAAEAALARQADDPRVELLLGRIALAARREAEAEARARRALTLDPALSDAFRVLGDALALQGRFVEAVDWWQRWLQVASHRPELSAEVDRIQEAVHAAQTLELLVRGSRG